MNENCGIQSRKKRIDYMENGENAMQNKFFRAFHAIQY